jgi:hypothetical protein
VPELVDQDENGQNRDDVKTIQKVT